MFIPWLKFFICVALIVYSGIKVSKYGDIIAEKTGLGGTWIGVLLLASMTSLPELVTGASSVLLASVPNLAVGTIFGSAVFNLAIIALMDLCSKEGPVLKKAQKNHLLTAAFGIVLLSIAACSLVLDQHITILQVLWFNICSPLILTIYFIGMRIIYKIETQTIAIIADTSLKYQHISKTKTYQFFALHAVVIIAISTWLPFIGDEIALLTGWGNTFFGTVFIALATSLPEIVISLSALRIGAIDMAIGGVLGSNLFNLGILAVDDLLYFKGSLFADVSATHLLPALSSILMSAIVVACLHYRPRFRNTLRMSWFTVLFMSMFFLTAYLVFVLE